MVFCRRFTSDVLDEVTVISNCHVVCLNVALSPFDVCGLRALRLHHCMSLHSRDISFSYKTVTTVAYVCIWSVCFTCRLYCFEWRGRMTFHLIIRTVPQEAAFPHTHLSQQFFVHESNHPLLWISWFERHPTCESSLSWMTHPIDKSRHSWITVRPKTYTNPLP